jgi:hypothetical protein
MIKCSTPLSMFSTITFCMTFSPSLLARFIDWCVQETFPQWLYIIYIFEYDKMFISTINDFHNYILHNLVFPRIPIFMAMIARIWGIDVTFFLNKICFVDSWPRLQESEASMPHFLL